MCSNQTVCWVSGLTTLGFFPLSLSLSTVGTVCSIQTQSSIILMLNMLQSDSIRLILT